MGYHVSTPTLFLAGGRFSSSWVLATWFYAPKTLNCITSMIQGFRTRLNC